MAQTDFIHVPYGKAVYGEPEIEAVNKVLRTSTQMGKHVREMEDRVAALYAKKHGIMVNSGSSALYLAAELMNLQEGDEVLTPALTFSTTVAPIVKKGWVPAFLDVAEGTFNTDASKVEEMITPKTKGHCRQAQPVCTGRQCRYTGRRNRRCFLRPFLRYEHHFFLWFPYHQLRR